MFEIIQNCNFQDEYVLEDLDIGLNILIQRVFKTNFAASWDEQGDENQAEETYSLNTVKSLNGEHYFCLASTLLDSLVLIIASANCDYF